MNRSNRERYEDLAINIATVSNGRNGNDARPRIDRVQNSIVADSNSISVRPVQLFHAGRKRLFSQVKQRLGNACSNLFRQSTELLFRRPANLNPETHGWGFKSFRTSSRGRLGSCARASSKRLSCKSSRNCLSVIRNLNTRSRSASGIAWISAISSAALIETDYHGGASQATRKSSVDHSFSSFVVNEL